ncbi:hypothetical protein OIDMADRAFT_35089 [Oidiodendron maius Zn]|uniref:Uncharacterized protein n=1 Tax=Oidiodendron maius (strain Zn) TaxID=913774 RepID=A0A0C3GCZ5_OIDMZ|nr:hypothetical protein OIDMADRAFT_35089 [Oidiodendron maius Zn]
MYPPLSPSRQLPLPQGQISSSPTALSFLSSSAPLPRINSDRIGLPTPSSINYSIASYLTPITAPQAPEAAPRMKCRVPLLLPSEHDELLAAFSRSQTQAISIRKSHAILDNEIISLREEKLRLQERILDLEQDVERLFRSREEFRQAAKQEVAQYTKIVNKATQLEEIRVDETRSWNRIKEEMERRIAELSAGGRGKGSGDGEAEPSDIAQAI